MPHFFLAGVGQPERHIVRPAYMAQVIHVLVRAADLYKVLAHRTHARAVITKVQRIRQVHYSSRLAANAVETIQRRDFFEGRIAERIVLFVHVSELVHMQNDVTVLLEGLDY
jgi:hypothetical protein